MVRVATLSRPPSANSIASPSRDDFTAMLEQSFVTQSPQEGQVIKGIIVSIENDFAMVDVGLKTEGRISLKEFSMPGIPATEPQRSESITLLRESGVDHVLTFRTILENLVQAVESNQSYAKSDTLQLLRLLRVYDMVKAAQLELFGGANSPK